MTARMASPSRSRVAERILHLAHALEPAVAREDDGHLLVDDEVLGDELGLLPAGAADLGAALVLEAPRHLGDLAAHHLEELALVTEDRLDLLGATLLLGQLGEDEVDLQPGQLVELELEDRVGLLVRQLEALRQLGGGVGLAIRLADDPDRLVEHVEDEREAFEDMDAALQLGQLELEPPAHRLLAEGEELTQHRRQVDPQGSGDLFVVRRKEAGEVDVEPGLERRVLVEVRHHQIGIGARLHLQHDADVISRLVAHIDQQRELLVDDHVGDPLDDARLGERVRDRGDDDVVAATCLPPRSSIPRAPARPPAPSRRCRAALSCCW